MILIYPVNTPLPVKNEFGGKKYKTKEGKLEDTIEKQPFTRRG